MKHAVSTRHQNGFTVIEIVLSLGLIAAIAAAGYFAYQAKQQHEKKPAAQNTQARSVATRTPQPGPYDNWKTYESRCANLSFKHPADWTIKAQSGDFAYLDKCNPVPVNFVSPKGNILAWIPFYYGDGPGCDYGPLLGSDCPTITTVSSESLGKSGKLASVRLVKRVVCAKADPLKCEGQIVLAAPDTSAKLDFEVGVRKENTSATFGTSALYMTQSRISTWANPPGVNGKYTEAEAHIWLESTDANAAALAMQSLE